MQITKQQAGLLYGNSYLLQDKQGMIFKIGGINTDYLNYPFFIAYNQSGTEHEIFFTDIGKDYKILARRNDLTKPIIVEGKEVVPYIEVFKLAQFRTFDYEAYNHFQSLNIEITDGILKFEHNAKKFHFYLEGTDIVCQMIEPRYEPIKIANQLQCFEWLQSHNFQVNLPKELVTYNDNVYNS